MLLLWTTLNLGGGILTALHFPILPFEPEQTQAHYLAHAIYALAQVPLLWLLILARTNARGGVTRRGGKAPLRQRPLIERLPRSVRVAVPRAPARARGQIA